MFVSGKRISVGKVIMRFHIATSNYNLMHWSYKSSTVKDEEQNQPDNSNAFQANN